MSRIKQAIKSIFYSVNLYYQSSGLLIVLYLTLYLLSTSFSLFHSFSLKCILDGLTDEQLRLNSVILWAVLYFLSIFLLRVNSSATSITGDCCIKKAELLYDCRLADKLSKLPLSYIDSSVGRDMIDDVRYSRGSSVYLVSRLILIITSIYSFVVTFSILVGFNIWLSIILLMLTIPGALLSDYFERKSDKLRCELAPDNRKFSYYRWMLTDAWPAKDVRMYNLTDAISARYNEEKTAYIAANKRLEKKAVKSLILADIIRHSGEFALVVFSVFEAIKGHISIGDVALYTGFALTVGNSFEIILRYTVMIIGLDTERMERVFEFYNIKTYDQSKPTRELNEFQSVTFENVFFKYPYTEKYVLSGVSFTLNKGDKLSIVGINGSGKSTIIKLMLGLYNVDSGRILVNGYPMSDYDISDVRRMFSVLFQNFVQYPLTLRENVSLSDSTNMENDNDIETALVQSGVYDELQPKLENGLNSFMTRQFDNKGTELSRGQWQKIAISRAYFKKAPVIIFDEPSAALDAEAENRIFRNFEDITEGKTGIMISHRISSARISNKIIVLDNGIITEQGTHEELLAHEGLYSKLYNLQRDKYSVKEVD